MLYSKNCGLLAVLCMILLIACLPSASTSPLELSFRGADHDDRSSLEIGPGKRGAVATENALCSRHGIEMLKMGGNAADAVSALSLHYRKKYRLDERLKCISCANGIDSWSPRNFVLVSPVSLSSRHGDTAGWSKLTHSSYVS
jgi:hypothetical protein